MIFFLQKLFSEEEGKPLLISLLNAIMRRNGEQEINGVTIIENKVLTPELIDNKESSLDVLCETDANEKINVEMQVQRVKRMDYRSLYYITKLFTLGIRSGEDYSELKRTVGINMLDHHYLPLEKFHHTFHLYEDEHREYLLTDVLEWHFLEFPKFREIKFDINDPLHRWMQFLEQQTTHQQLEEMMKVDDTIRIAEERLSNLASDEETRLRYEAREKALHDRASWLKDAHEEGMEKGMVKSATAVKLLMEGTDLSEIAENTGLTIDEIEKIKLLAGIKS